VFIINESKVQVILGPKINLLVMQGGFVVQEYGNSRFIEALYEKTYPVDRGMRTKSWTFL